MASGSKFLWDGLSDEQKELAVIAADWAARWVQSGVITAIAGVPPSCGRVGPPLVMASTSSAGAAPNAPAVGGGDVQKLQLPSCNNDSLPNATAPAPMSPLLLASVCCGSSGALKLVFDREDAQEPPMVVPTQAFLDLLVGHNPGTGSSSSSTGSSRRLTTVPQASHDVEHGVHQPVWPEIEADVIVQRDLPAAWLLKGVTAEGDTALHAVASHGDTTEFQECARIINDRDQGLLFVVNTKGDTPLHCAARAGKSQMISFLIELAKNSNRLHELLRKENDLKETALHDAVRIGRKDIVESLMVADPELANYPKEGTSPLYLAIVLSKRFLPETLHDKSKGNLSYSGPNGRNALHAAVCKNSEMTELMLKWNDGLTTHGDGHGSTPLHLVLYFQNFRMFRRLFEANPTLVYRADNKGLFPIHVAASMGRRNILNYILKKFPSSAGLRTAQGKTFLHVAIENERLNIVSFACRTTTLAWILNMQDNDGNTALHFAVKVSRLRIFCCLHGNKAVHLNLANKDNETPAYLSWRYVPDGMNYNWDNEIMIYRALIFWGDDHSGLHYQAKYSCQLQPEDKVKEAEKVKDSSQILGLGSVLIATVAFGACFAVPGGFIADDHTNRGTPTLAGRYTFDAFMMANALAFICSSIATVGLMFSGSPLFNLRTRKINLNTSYFFMSTSVTCLSAAFALGVYMVLAPVAHATAIVICVLSPLVVLYGSFDYLLKVVILARPICLRVGKIRALKWLASMMVGQMFAVLWPFILIFGWSAIARNLRNHL